MNFLNDLYYIDASSKDEAVQKYIIRMNPNHVIYSAHFPGEPITPGVCILQIGFELLSLTLSQRLEITTIKNVKFLSILRPENQTIEVKIKSDIIDSNSVKAQIEMNDADKQIAKISMTCQIVQKA